MKKIFQITAIIICTLLGTTSCMPDAGNNPPLETVASVDVNQYLGKWYEIGSIPQFFSVGCNCTTAEYDFYPNGSIRVRNRCNLGSAAGALSAITGKALPVRGSNNTKLKVSFAGTPSSSNYWIIDLASDYSYAVVSDPLRATCFVLSRTPQMDETLYQSLLAGAAAKGINTNEVKRTNQDGCW